jgi:hypothetical protein
MVFYYFFVSEVQIVRRRRTKSPQASDFSFPRRRKLFRRKVAGLKSFLYLCTDD